VAWLDTEPPDIVFTDAYPVDTDYQRAVRDRVTLVVMQDDARHAVCADAFVNGNLYAPELDYGWDGDEPDWYLGTEYLLLRRSFRRLMRRDPPRRDAPERGLILMGGSDTENTTPRAMRAFASLCASLEVTVIVGPGVDDHDGIKRVASESGVDYRIREDPESLPELMFDADVAVSALGSTAYELLATRTPFVGVVHAANQRLIADALINRDAAIVADGDDPSTLADALEPLVTNRERWRQLRERASEFVSGEGSAAVASVLESLG
jgi:spore coat polysaccharide biosynthesis predicted glycosyltransferase SpsG